MRLCKGCFLFSLLSVQYFLTHFQNIGNNGHTSISAIAAFFQTEIGQRLRTATNVQREFKFSILDDGREYVPGLQGEQVLLQGVVDCALIEPDGITVLDFKSDRGSAKELDTLVDRYRLQVNTYAQALSRIFELPIKAKGLYFFHHAHLTWL